MQISVMFVLLYFFFPTDGWRWLVQNKYYKKEMENCSSIEFHKKFGRLISCYLFFDSSVLFSLIASETIAP